jgi:hypothetical protein
MLILAINFSQLQEIYLIIEEIKHILSKITLSVRS